MTNEKDREEAKAFCETAKIIQEVTVNGVRRPDEIKYPFNTPENIDNMTKFVACIRSEAYKEGYIDGCSKDGTQTERDKAMVTEAVNEAREDEHTRRWNFEPTDDGIRVCFGEHDRSDGCEYIEYVPRSAVDEAVKEERERCEAIVTEEILEYDCDLTSLVNTVVSRILSDDQEANCG